MASDSMIKNITRRISAIEDELTQLKRQVAMLRGADKVKQAQQVQATATAEQQPVAARPEPVQKKRPVKTGKNRWELEQLFTGNILGKLGILAIVIATAWFIKFAIDKHYINESVRVMLGIVIGSLMSWFGLHLYKKKYRVLSFSLFGGGISVISISIFGAYYFYDLLATSETFVMLLLLMVFTSIVSRRAESQALLIFSIIGAFILPVVMSHNENSYKFLFSYLTIINLFYFWLRYGKQFYFTGWVLLAANYIMYTGWSFSNLADSGFLIPFLFIVVTFTILQLSENLVQSTSKVFHVFRLIFTIVNLFAFSILSYTSIDHFYPGFTAHWLLIITGLLLLLFKESHRRNKTLTDTALTQAFEVLLLWGVLTVAGIDFFNNSLLSLMLIILSGLFAIAVFHKNNLFLNITASFFFVIALMRLLFFEERAINAMAIINIQFSLFVIAAVVSAYLGYLATRHAHRFFRITYFISSVVIIILGSMYENYYEVADSSFKHLNYSYILAFYASIFLITGIVKKKPFLRITGMVLAGVMVMKLYLYDIWLLSTTVRIIAGFSLGVFLVILSLFYQKFKDRILPGLKVMLLFSFTFAIVYGTKPVYAADDFRTAGFFYLKDLKPSGSMTGQARYGKFMIDDDLYKNSRMYDIRIVAGEETLPYFTRPVFENPAKTDVSKIEVIYDNASNNERVYVLRLPEISENRHFTRLIFSSGSNFETSAQIQFSNDAKSWQNLGYYSLYRYDNASETSINLKQIKARYLRIRLNQNEYLKFISAVHRSDLQKEFFTETFEKDSDRIIYEVTSANDSIIKIENPMRRKVNRLQLTFKDSRYDRRIEIDVFDKSYKRFTHYYSTSLIKVSGEPAPHSIDLGNQNAESIRVVIENGNDDPLELKQVSLVSEVEEVIFELPTAISPDTDLKVYYGNEYAYAARYDISSTVDFSQNFTDFKLLKQEDNPDFGYSIFYPPLSVYILRGLFVLMLIFLTFFVYRFTRENKKAGIVQ